MPYPPTQRDASRSAGVFLRLSADHAQLLDRAAAAVSARKKDVVAGLVSRYVDPDTPGGLALLRDISAPGGSPRRVVVETEDSQLQTGHHSFSPDPIATEVLDIEQAAQLLAVDSQLILQLAERGELPGRRLGNQWRFSRQALVRWLSEPALPQQPPANG